jgi:hypothetical protein
LGIWQWRKSFGRGPFRITFSKKGVGYSVGVPGVRLGRSPTGKAYVSQFIPGTGFRKITYLDKSKARPPGSGPIATPPAVGSPPSLPSPVAASAPVLGALLVGGVRGLFLRARSIVRLTGRGWRGLAHSMVSSFDWLNTRRRAGWTFKPPPVMLPAPPPSAPVSSAPTSLMSLPAAPPPTTALVPPPASLSATPWWKQKLGP